MKKVLFVGVPKGKRCHNQILCENITEIFNKMLDIYPDQDAIAAVIGDHEYFKDFRPSRVFIDYEEQEAVEEFIKLYGKKTNLSVVK